MQDQEAKKKEIKAIFRTKLHLYQTQSIKLGTFARGRSNKVRVFTPEQINIYALKLANNKY